MTWRYVAFSAPGGRYLGELDLTDVELTRKLSGPGRLTGKLTATTLPDGVRPWAATVWAEASGQIRGGGALAALTDNEDGTITLDCMGLSGLPGGQPYDGPEVSEIQIDPLVMVRRIWTYLQTQPDGNLGITLDATTSPIKVGDAGYWVKKDPGNPDAEEKPVPAPPNAGAIITGLKNRDKDAPKAPDGYRYIDPKPFELNWWTTTDLGQVFNRLATDTPFDYLEHTTWAGDQLAHRIQLGYPTISGRKTDLRFAVGENITERPLLDARDEDYASDVLALGAGEGQAMVRAPIISHRGRGIRRVHLLIDKTATDPARLTDRARSYLAAFDGHTRLREFEIHDHSHAPIGSFDVGDEIFITGPDRWVRITTQTIHPDQDTVTITCEEA
jgi:hypothetical protein